MNYICKKYILIQNKYIFVLLDKTYYVSKIYVYYLKYFYVINIEFYHQIDPVQWYKLSTGNCRKKYTLYVYDSI